MKLEIIRNQKGSIALTTVIALSAILILAGITLVQTTVDFARSTKSYENIFRAQLNSNSCLEEALYRLGRDEDYNGDLSISDNGNSCDATTSTDLVNADIKVVTIESIVDDHYNNVTYRIDTSTSELMILK